MFDNALYPRLSFVLLWALLIWRQVCAQYPSLRPQTDTFNSSLTITPAQQDAAGINATLANNIAVALNFERSNFAKGPASADKFYLVPRKSAKAAAGKLLKLELDANTSVYTLPPNTALSRILYQSESSNGSVVPTSAYILWPYLLRTQSDGFPIVAWAHGTSGIFGNCAPSNYRNLLYQFASIFELVTQGYVVVAPDYAGLGVTRDAQGNPLTHPYLDNPSHANDLFYAVQAARSAFPSFSKRFVVMGHSQGGGAAWAAAVRQAQKPVKGYLGAIVGSPVTSLIGLIETGGVSANAGAAAFIARTLTNRYSGFKLSDVLTPAGIGRLNLMAEIQGCFSTAAELFADEDLVYLNWTKNARVREYDSRTNPAERRFAGPMLVLQGEGDHAVPVSVTTRYVDKTCTAYPESQLEYKRFEGVTHVPVMFASQRMWLDFIEARFRGDAMKRGCERNTYTSARPYKYYQKQQNWFVEFSTQGYQTA